MSPKGLSPRISRAVAIIAAVAVYTFVMMGGFRTTSIIGKTFNNLLTPDAVTTSSLLDDVPVREIEPPTLLTFEPDTPPNPPPPPPPLPPPEAITSHITLIGSLNDTLDFSRKRYRFENVYLKDESTLQVWLPPSIPLPTQPYAIDVITGHSTEPYLPTSIFYRNTHTFEYNYLGIEYYHTDAPEPAPQAHCTRWEERPVYLLQVPHTQNSWHVWNDGLMGAFQTLREEGLLPLAEVDAEGNMVEHIDDLEEECPWEYEIGGNWEPHRGSECRPRHGVISQTRCDPLTEAWCRSGLVAVNTTNGPILLLANGTEQPEEKWRGMFLSISEDIRDWNTSLGVCFKELYIGKSNLLNFYLAISPKDPPAASLHHLRREALASFQRLMHTGERHRILLGRANVIYEEEWMGYEPPELERFRHGVGPEEVYAVEGLRELRTQLIDNDSKWGNEEIQRVLGLLKEEKLVTRRLIARRAMEEKELIEKDESLPPQTARPVITYMWRSAMKRNALNAPDILEYILRRFNVTLRLTTFDEPLIDMLELMNTTDVLIGVHGAGWTNGMFLKQGAGALQIFPYAFLNNSTGRYIRGSSYKNIVEAKDAKYREWVSVYPENAFMRPRDWGIMERKGNPIPYEFSINPQPDWERPVDGKPTVNWVYQNTLVSMHSIAPVLDKLMVAKGARRISHRPWGGQNRRFYSLH